MKRKYIKTNRSNFITKELCKAIMQMPKLCNLYLDVRSDENRSKTDLVECNNLITDEICFAKIFNDFFVNVVSNPGLNIFKDNFGKGDVSNYDNQSSIISIKQHITNKNRVFSFRNVTKERFILRLRH